MKAAVIFTFALLLLAAIVDVSFQERVLCQSDPEICKKDECCGEISLGSRYSITACKPLLKEGDRCSLKTETSAFDSRIYEHYCPCDSSKNLVCQENGSDKYYGTCGQK